MRTPYPLSLPFEKLRRHACDSLILCACLVTCAGAVSIPAALADETETRAAAEQDDSPFTVPFEKLWEPWTGDLPGMVERRVLRVVVPYGGYQFYYDGGAPKGAVYELLKKLEDHLNKQLGRRNIRVYVATIPMSRDRLLSALLAGNADLIAADLTETERRKLVADFTRPLLTDIDEIVVAGPESAPLASLDDLSKRSIFVRASSSYHEHLIELVADFEKRGLEPPSIVLADELLEAHDILEMVNAGLVDLTVVDDYKADFWKSVYPNLTLHRELAIHTGGQTSWAYRKDSPELAAFLQGFMKKYGKGTLVGNDTYTRYLSNAERVRCAPRGRDEARVLELETAFRSSAAEFDFDWLMIAAQAFQESRFQENRRSPAGAVGIMQIKPSTAADRNVGITDISTIENNVRAGSKYLRFVIDRYFSDDDMDEVNRWLFGLAAYNAGPARITRLRREARTEGYDPNVWFNNVEIIAGRRIGRETVTYVGNIYKYFVGYRLAQQREQDHAKFKHVLSGCAAGDTG